MAIEILSVQPRNHPSTVKVSGGSSLDGVGSRELPVKVFELLFDDILWVGVTETVPPVSNISARVADPGGVKI